MKRYPPIGEYALIGDCHTAALVSRDGAIDWCCLPRFDSDSCFGRLLDWNRGGFFAIAPVARATVTREYVRDSLILVTTFTTRSAQVRLIDFFAMTRGGRTRPRRELIRIVEGVRGRMRLRVTVMPRLDFGSVKPWIYPVQKRAYAAVGSNTGLLVFGDVPLTLVADHELRAEISVSAGKRRHLAIWVAPPEAVTAAPPDPKTSTALDAHLRETRRWWQVWASKMTVKDRNGAGLARSAIVLKALNYAPTGAIIAAPTTSLPELSGGERNWDYRFSWVRDSVFTVRALSALGLVTEADGFRSFIQRSAAGNANELQVLYGIDGKRRLTEVELTYLEGWRGSKPVRIGNAAELQFQSDVYGMLLELSARWSERGNSPSPSYWRFLTDLVECAIAKWRLPDRGIWEIRSTPRHFVHSKVMCWVAVDRGIALAELHRLRAPLKRWRRVCGEMRATIERHGVDAKRGVFRQSFRSRELDAALLLLPSVGFVDWKDERMVRTVEAIRRGLMSDGLIARYRSVDGLRGREGTFVGCSFWLAECLARQGKLDDARQIFNRAQSCSNDLGLFSEEYSPRERQMLGNFPQGLTHLAHISAALALDEVDRPKQRTRRSARSARAADVVRGI
jgi:GH15 family glucan-1,4-alpha-glucosidase